MEELDLELSDVAQELVSPYSVLLFCLEDSYVELQDLTGSNVIVAGTALFGAENPKEVVEGFKKAVDDSKSVWGTEAALQDA
jgi:hypothetical protein